MTLTAQIELVLADVCGAGSQGGKGFTKGNTCAKGGNTSWESSEDVVEDFEYAESVDDIKAAMEHYGGERLEFLGKTTDYWMLEDGEIVEWDGKDTYTDVTYANNVGELVYDADLSTQQAEYEDNFNREFWDSPGPVFHATEPENIDSIKENGLEARAATRGMSNRSVGSAVFTSVEPEEITFHYGPSLIEIDTEAMAKDGYKPYVSQEPIISEGEIRSAFAHKLGDERFEPEFENGMSHNTIIIGGDIPAKYLKFDE